MATKYSITSPLVSELSDLLSVWREHRRNTVESQWMRAWKNYNSIDDGAVPPKTRSAKSWRSTSFYPLVEQKVMSAVALLDDVLFKYGKVPYDLKNSPMSDMIPAMSLQVSPEQIQQIAFQQRLADEKSKRMKRNIDDSFVECDAVRQLRNVVHSMGLYGTGPIESPCVVRVKRNFWEATSGDYVNTIKEEDAPSIRALDVWDCFPDPECEGDVQKGLGFFHRQWMSMADLQALYLTVKRQADVSPDETGIESYSSGYVLEEFLQLIENGEKNAALESRNEEERPGESSITQPARTYAVYTFAGKALNRALRSYVPDLEGDDSWYSEVLVVFCGGSVLKVVKNPYPNQKRPYHLVPWTQVPGSPWGRGVAHKVAHAQANVNALIRLYVDNKKLSGNLMTAINKKRLAPGETMDIYPGKNWQFDGHLGDSDIRQSIMPVVLPDVTGGVLEAIGTMLDWADQASGIPRILEGQPGAPSSTAYAESQRVQSASKQLGLVLKNLDIYGIQPIVESFYDWNMQFSNDKTIKGDFNIVATGFATFESKTMKRMDLERFFMMSQQSPILAQWVKAPPLIQDMVEAGNVDPDRYLLTEAEVQANSQAQSQEQMQTQAAAMELQRQQVELTHQYEMELAQAKTVLQGQVKAAIEKMRAESKILLDQQKQQTVKLITSAKLEADMQKDAANNLQKIADRRTKKWETRKKTRSQREIENP